MKVTIDLNSGFCFGVVNAIQMTEEILDRGETLYCLGDIVHNETEVRRLKQKGLKIINYKEFRNLKHCKVLIRAHGEPPKTYKIALKNNITLVDASCPVVLKLQNTIRLGYEKIKKEKGQIVIFGKKGHAEVNGLVGQTRNNAIIITDENDIDKIDFFKPIYLYSQTTKSISEYNKIKTKILEYIQKRGKNGTKTFFYETICRQVSNRIPQLEKFAKQHDVIIFVSSKKSSNGKMLFHVCQNQNPRTFLVSNKRDLRKKWFVYANTIGICGATSTPMWFMKKIAKDINTLIKN